MAARKPIVSIGRNSRSSALQELKAQDTLAGVLNDADVAANTIAGKLTGSTVIGLTPVQVRALIMPVAAEATGAVQAINGTLHPINVSAGTSLVTPPADPVIGDMFGVVDSRGASATFNITVDTSGPKLHGASADRVISTNSACVMFRYVDATVGWIVQSS